ncbi:MAG: sugar nucleotide-binding protein [Eubacteriales bacterium]
MYIIFGANGFLGSYIVKSIVENTDEKVIAVARNLDGMICSDRVSLVKCEITDSKDVDALAETLKKGETCKIIYLVTYNNIDLVAKYPKLAWDINIISLASFLNKVENLNCLFFSSTDCVYGEGKPDYCFKETDLLEPINLYGVYKIAAESLVTARGYNVLRLPYMFGPSISPQKKHFYDKIVEDLKQQKTIEMFHDSLRSSLDYKTVADLFVSLAENYSENNMPKIMNLCGDDCLSKYDLGLMMADKFGASRDLIVPVSSKNDDSVFVERRAFAGLMDNSLLKSTLGISELKIKI